MCARRTGINQCQSWAIESYTAYSTLAQNHLEGSQRRVIQMIENPLLNEVQVAQMLGISKASLRRWRLLGKQGPPFVKIGASVRYVPAAVSAWLRSRPAGGER
jgi:predicted DNA-binding transcriptional regulator AlpA